MYVLSVKPTNYFSEHTSRSYARGLDLCAMRAQRAKYVKSWNVILSFRSKPRARWKNLRSVFSGGSRPSYRLRA